MGYLKEQCSILNKMGHLGLLSHHALAAGQLTEEAVQDFQTLEI